MKTKHQIITLIFVSIVVYSTLANASDPFTARVTSISDGDTITVLYQGQKIKIRLAYIDCPEGGQAYGNRAKKFLSGLVRGKTVTIIPRDKDQYGRIVAEVILHKPDGRVVNYEMVRAGYAWWFRKYAPDKKSLKAMEAKAREERRGLWADPNAIPPWEWRRLQREKVEDENSIGIPPGAIIGNTRSMVYHRPDCPAYLKVSPKNRVFFQTEEKARAAGYHLAGNCK